jgi:hypothetical protein
MCWPQTGHAYLNSLMAAGKAFHIRAAAATWFLRSRAQSNTASGARLVPSRSFNKGKNSLESFMNQFPRMELLRVGTTRAPVVVQIPCCFATRATFRSDFFCEPAQFGRSSGLSPALHEQAEA